MLSRGRPLRLHALRDALGIVRTLYAVEARDGGDTARMLAIAGAGRRLKLALELGATNEDNLGRRAATTHAEEAFAALKKLADVSPELLLLVDAAKSRAIGDHVDVPLSKREAKRLAGERR